MKRILFVKAILLCLSMSLIGQTYKATITSVEVNKAVRPAISVVSEAEHSALQKAWVSYLRKEYGVKSNSRRNAVTSKDFGIPAISNNNLKGVYAFFNKHKNGSEIIAAIEISEGNFVSQTNYTEAHTAFVKLVEKFVNDYCRDQLSSIIKDKKKALSKDKKSNSKLEKKNKKLEKQINKNQKSIESSQKKIEGNKNQIKENKSTLQQLKKDIEAAEKELKSLEQRKKKLD